LNLPEKCRTGRLPLHGPPMSGNTVSLRARTAFASSTITSSAVGGCGAHAALAGPALGRGLAHVAISRAALLSSALRRIARAAARRALTLLAGLDGRGACGLTGRIRDSEASEDEAGDEACEHQHGDFADGQDASNEDRWRTCSLTVATSVEDVHRVTPSQCSRTAESASLPKCRLG